MTRVVFGGSLQVTAPPLEQKQLPHGVAVTSSEHRQASARTLEPPLLHVSIDGRARGEITLSLSSAVEIPEKREKTEKEQRRESALI